MKIYKYTIELYDGESINLSFIQGMKLDAAIISGKVPDFVRIEQDEGHRSIAKGSIKQFKSEPIMIPTEDYKSFKNYERELTEQERSVHSELKEMIKWKLPESKKRLTSK